MDDHLETLQSLADATRLRIVRLLLGGSATVSELAARLGLPQPRVSAHLALLRDAGLVSAEQTGRQRVYRADRERLLPLFAALDRLAPGEDMEMTTATTVPPRSAQADRLVRGDAPIRQARTCYDHLAGVLGVRLMDELLERGWLVAGHDDGKRTHYQLTDEGRRALAARGVDLAAAESSRRMHAYGCTDWTERRPHLGGALGAAVLAALAGADAIARIPGSREVEIRASLDDWLAG